MIVTDKGVRAAGLLEPGDCRHAKNSGLEIVSIFDERATRIPSIQRGGAPIAALYRREKCRLESSP